MSVRRILGLRDTAYAVAYGSALADWRVGRQYTSRTQALLEAAGRVTGVDPLAVHPSVAVRHGAEEYADEFCLLDGGA